MGSSAVSNWGEPAEAHAGEVRKLSTLLEASQALSSTLDLKEGLGRVLEILGRHHGAIRGTVVLLNEQTGDVELEASSGDVTPGKHVRYRLGEGITGRVVETGTPIVVPRVSREPKFLNRAAERPELPEQELSYVSAPVTLEGKTVGAET
jgi:Nif-specific regulatory protein